MADEALGPISYLIVEFPGNKMTGEGLPILVDLVDRGLIRILDLQVRHPRHRRVDRGRRGDGSRRRRRARPHGLRGRGVGPARRQRPPGRGRRDRAPARRRRSSSSRTGGRRRFVQALHGGQARGRRGRLHPAGSHASRRSTQPSHRRETHNARSSSRHSPFHGRRRHRDCGLEPCLASSGQPLVLCRKSSSTRNNSGPRRRPNPAAAPAPAQDNIAQLKELAELHSQGVLTDEEFAVQKAKLLE